MTGDFRRIVWTIAHLPASACTTSAPGSKSPLGRGGGAAQRALGVLPGFPVVGGRLCVDARLRGQGEDGAGSRADTRRDIVLRQPHVSALDIHLDSDCPEVARESINQWLAREYQPAYSPDYVSASASGSRSRRSIATAGV